MIGLGYPNIADTATASGGSWLAGLPASNVQTRSFANVARSADAAAASTKIKFDHGSAKAAQVLCLAGHNLSSAATIKWSRGTTDGGNDVYAGSAVNVWQITPTAFDGRAYAAVIVLPQAYTARYDLIELSDTTNAAGYVEVARAWISTLWTPTYNAAYGLRDSVQDLSGVERSDGGALWVTARRKLRAVQLVLDALSLSEADDIHNLQMSAGTTEEVMYVPDVASSATQQRYGYIATIEELDAIEYPYYRTRSAPIRLKEVA
jgi:hypothetical protein